MQSRCSGIPLWHSNIRNCSNNLQAWFNQPESNFGRPADPHRILSGPFETNKQTPLFAKLKYDAKKRNFVLETIYCKNDNHSHNSSLPQPHRSATGSLLVIINPRTPKGVDTTPPGVFPCNFFDESKRKNRLCVSVTRDGRHILTYVTSSWRCHGKYVMTSNVHDGGQNTLFLPLFVNRDIFWYRCDEVMSLVRLSTNLRS